METKFIADLYNDHIVGSEFHINEETDNVKRADKAFCSILKTIEDKNLSGKVEDLAFSFVSASEENGFIMGFKYAMNLLMECKRSGAHTTAVWYPAEASAERLLRIIKNTANETATDEQYKRYYNISIIESFALAQQLSEADFNTVLEIISIIYKYGFVRGKRAASKIPKNTAESKV